VSRRHRRVRTRVPRQAGAESVPGGRSRPTSSPGSRRFTPSCALRRR
jgi:hypothetical protein